MDIETFVVKPYTVESSRGEGTVPVTVPIARATTTAHRDTKSFRQAAQAFVSDAYRSDFYSRIGNPTVNQVARRLAYMEKADEALLFSSGMGAVSSTLLSLLGTGDHLICQAPIYGHTHSFVTDYITQFGINVDFVVDPTATSVDKLINEKTKLIYLESPSNPCVAIVDIAEISIAAARRRVPVVVDSTFATPCLQNPLVLGASLVIHSGTKYLGGHSDVVCGAVAGAADLISVIHDWQIRLGAVVDPQGAWLLDRGIKTLPLRMERHCENARAVAKRLESNDDVIESVNCPMLANSRFYRLCMQQMPNGSGGVISFYVKGGMECARVFLDALEIVSIATSLGGVESLIEIPGDIHYMNKKENEDETANSGASDVIDSPVLVRFSVGIESQSDLLEDVGRGISAVRRLRHANTDG